MVAAVAGLFFAAAYSIPRNRRNRRDLKGVQMHNLKILLGTAALFVGMAIAPTAQAQITVGIGIQPVCSYGYYDYAPYGCAPMGFYGPGYFYNGIFLGMGPWAGWGYGHGWGGHRFVEAGGGSYRGGGGEAANHGRYGGASVRNGGARSGGGGADHHGPTASHPAGARPGPAHSTAPHGASHAAAPHGEGGHEGGGEHK